ncbi:MAG: hypothetical protein HOH43_19220, partial [Candidatus Latescibacteria bacterium]|nr:hypothetical protein [Candidatus Latescibacterota bacterium]
KNYLISILKKGGTRDLVVQSGTTRQTLVADESDISRGMYYDVSGYLVYKRGYFSWSGIWAKPFDLSTRTITGAPFPVAQNVLSYSLSSDGTLVYKSLIEAGAQQLVWVTRDGQIDGVIGRTQQTMSDPALSPDGRSVAVSAWEPGQDIAPWVYDVTRGSRIRLMAGIGGSTEPAWSPDGRQVAINGISVLAADGSGTPAQMAPGGNNASWSADGEYLVYVNGGTQEQRGERWRDIWYLEVNGNQQPVSLVQTPYNEGTPQVSPDGQFLAYVSDQSGREEVYVTAFPSGEGKWPVSVIGGTHPRWNPKGGELFYVEGDRLMSVSIAPGPQFEAEVPRPLFTQMESGVSLRARGPYWAPPYDVHSDGQRFVMIQSMSGTQAITVVENWHAEFQDR